MVGVAIFGVGVLIKNGFFVILGIAIWFISL